MSTQRLNERELAALEIIDRMSFHGHASRRDLADRLTNRAALPTSYSGVRTIVARLRRFGLIEVRIPNRTELYWITSAGKKALTGAALLSGLTGEPAMTTIDPDTGSLANANTRLKRRIAIARATIENAESRRRNSPDSWTTTDALNLGYAIQFLGGLEAAHMIVLEEIRAAGSAPASTFECQGCGAKLTSSDEADDHRQRHGLVINTTEPVTPAPLLGRAVSVYNPDSPHELFTGREGPGHSPWVGWHRVTPDGPVDLPPMYAVESAGNRKARS
jgi:hypothetical protein